MRHFLWAGDGEEGKKDHLVVWDRVCHPKEEGGFGLGNLMIFRNTCLVYKWHWFFPSESPPSGTGSSGASSVFRVRVGMLASVIPAITSFCHLSI